VARGGKGMAELFQHCGGSAARARRVPARVTA